MTSDAGMSDEAVKAATGRDWAEWRRTLDSLGAAQLTHQEIVGVVSNHGVGRWWQQMVTVGYERLTGKRAAGQRCDGAFSANASRTLAGDKDVALAKWIAVVEGMTEFDGIFAASEPRQSQSEKWRYWRIDLENGSKVSVMFSDKAGGKSVIAVDHERLADQEAVGRAKAFWKPLLAAMG
jgi:hypothetical protein